MTDDDTYSRWLEQRRGVRASTELVNCVMQEVARAAPVQRTRLLVLLMWIERSRARSVAACGGAFVVGSTPFVYLAYIWQTLVF